MSQNYYGTLLQQIEDEITAQNWKQALDLIQEELAMPYVPLEIEEKLLQQLHQVQTELNYATRSSRALDIEQIEELMKKDEASQLIAVSALDKMNLHHHLDLVQDFLNEGCTQAVALLIDSCVQQKVEQSLEVEKDGCTYEFIPSACTSISESDGVRKALAELELWFNKEPSFARLAQQLVIQEAYLLLPLSVEEEEALDLALRCAKETAKCCHQESEFAEFCRQRDIDVDKIGTCRSLNIEK